ncbi:MAG TPA: hypothetical protein VJ742_12935 [Nitrososphaera sp.]|nr:hypothetical protein [Nitrososphaera sp.]
MDEPKRFRKKNPYIVAIQYTGENTAAVVRFLEQHTKHPIKGKNGYILIDHPLRNPTSLFKTDWIVIHEDGKGALQALKNPEFQERFELFDDHVEEKGQE